MITIKRKPRPKNGKAKLRMDFGTEYAFHVPFWKERKKLELTGATVLTGANGCGKTGLLKAVALYMGLNPELHNLNETKGELPNKASSGIEEIVGLSDVDNVFLHSPVDHIRGRGWVATILDVQRAMLQRKSHGELTCTMLAGLMTKLGEQLTKGGKYLVLLDEPEAGLDIELIMHTCHHIEALAKVSSTCYKNDKIKGELVVVITTQNPFILQAAIDGGAARVDMGGWREIEDPYRCFEGDVLFNICKQVLNNQSREGKVETNIDNEGKK